MNFDRPEFLFAGVLAVLPGLLYLSRYVRSKRTAFPAACFLFGKDRRPLARLRSRQIAAALLRGGVILLATLAFAGPSTTRSPRHEEERLARLVIVLDTSASMAAEGEDGRTLLDLALDQIRNQLAGLSPDIGVALVACPRPVSTLHWLSPEQAENALVQVQQSWQRCDLPRLLEHLQSAVDDRVEVTVYSDFAQRPERRQALVRLQEQLPTLRLESLVGRPDNLSLDALYPDHDRVEALVLNRGPMPRQGALTVTCGERSRATPFAVDAEGRSAVLLELPPDVSPGPCQVRLPDDGYGLDNALYFSHSQPERLQVLVVDGAPAGAPGQAPSIFVAKALRAARREINVVRVTQPDLTYDSIGVADILVLVDPRPLPTYLERAVVEFLQRGRPVWLLAGNNLVTWPDENVLFPGSAFRRMSAVVEHPFRLNWINRSDPAVSALAGLRDEQLRSWTTLRHVAPSFVRPQQRVLARFSDRAPAMLRYPLGAGEVVLWTFVPELDNGNAPLHPLFPLAVQELVDTLTPLPEIISVPPVCTVGRPCRVGEDSRTEQSFERRGKGDVAVATAQHGQVRCAVPGPYHASGAAGAELAFSCRPMAGEGAFHGARLAMEREPLRESPVSRTAPRRFSLAPLLLLAAFLLVFIELWMVSGRTRAREGVF